MNYIKYILDRFFCSRFAPNEGSRYYRTCMQQIEKLQYQSWMKAIYETTVIKNNRKKDIESDYVQQFSKIVDKIRLHDDGYFVYPLDTTICRLIPEDATQLASITVDFEKVLNSNLLELRESIAVNVKNTGFCTNMTLLIDSIIRLGNKVREYYSLKPDTDLHTASQVFPEILYRKPSSFEEALQKILFYNALFWQMKHLHIGLGRLDQILYTYYVNDIKKGKLDKSKTKQLLLEFSRILHKDYRCKSASLYGDTGQYILLGGVDRDGINVDNELTNLFLEVFAENPMIDPKLILRVNDHTSDEIWIKAVECIANGCGSPLIMNETKIMKGMIEFGYDKEDVYNVGTSACWEPLIIGKSFDQNNPFYNINILKCVNLTIYSGNTFENFEEFSKEFERHLNDEFERCVLKKKKFDCSPLFSLFFDDCIKNERDFASGGAKYAYHGAQVLGLPNAVNALLNIKKYVFDEKLLTIEKLSRILNENYVGAEDIRMLFLAGDNKFGKCNKEVIEMTNLLMNMSSIAASKQVCNGQPIKVGFSSPGYISYRNLVGATPDGRKKGEPLAVHISPISKDIDIVEILNFATKLDYSFNRLNGNVVDFIVPSGYVNAPEKFKDILKNSIREGLFEIQLNVLDKATLMDAKKHPEKYPDLIVRVWGFSAYFNELPESYKDSLISRATVYESV